MDTIGKMLAEQRKNKGLDHIDVEHATGIRALYVKALEEGRYDVLPGEVYVKGFLRNYGNFLGLDGAQLVHLYSDSIMENDHPQVVEHKQTRTTDKPTGARKWFGILAVVVTLCVAGGVLYSWHKGPPVPVPAAGKKEPAVSQVSLPPAASPVQPSVAATLPPAKAVVLAARFTDRCWTSAIADGKTVYEGIPKIGETLTWEAERQIIVNLGNAAAVEISLNGQPQGKMGERGDVVVKTFAAPGTSPGASGQSTAAPVSPPAVTGATPVTPGTSPATPSVRP